MEFYKYIFVLAVFLQAFAMNSLAEPTPHNIDNYLGKSYQPDCFRYLPRQGGADIGRNDQYDPACYKQFFINQTVFLRKSSRQQSG